MGACASKTSETIIEPVPVKSALKQAAPAPATDAGAEDSAPVRKPRGVSFRDASGEAEGQRSSQRDSEPDSNSEGTSPAPTRAYQLRSLSGGVQPTATLNRANSDIGALRPSGGGKLSRSAHDELGSGSKLSRSMTMVGTASKPEGKNVISGARVEVAPSATRRRTTCVRDRRRSVVGAAAGSRASPAPAGKKWATFEPVKLDSSLSASDRELARSRLRAALSKHFMFSAFGEAQLGEAVGAMRHRIVKAGNTATVQGEPASQFYVCTRGGFEMTITPAGAAADAKQLLVAQVAPAGSFGSGALLRHDASVQVTSTAAVDSEVFTLSRDVFHRLSRAKGTAAASEAAHALLGTEAPPSDDPDAPPAVAPPPPTPLARLPRASLDGIAGRMERLVVPVGSTLADVTAPSDAWLALLAAGTLSLAPKPPKAAKGASECDSELDSVLSASPKTPAEPKAPATPGSGMKALAKFAPAAGANFEAGDVVACGGAADETALAALYSASAADDGRKLCLLEGASKEWLLTAASECIVYRVPLRAVGAALQASPKLICGTPVGVRALLQAQPHFCELSSSDLDQLSFAFGLTTVPLGTPIVREGKPASRLHVILHGGVERAVAPKFGRFASFTKKAQASMLAMVAATCGPGDVLGAASVLGAGKKERATATPLSEVLCLSIDRAAAASLFPPSLAAVILARPDEAKLLTAERMDVGLLEWDHHIARGTFGSVGQFKHPTLGMLAVKKVEKAIIDVPPLRRQAMAERAALAAFDHPCICKLLATHKTAVALYYVLELCDGPELYSVLQEHAPLPEETIRAYAACIVAGLAALHGQRWVYRDVKAENVVLTSKGDIKIVDFGLARRLPPAGRCFTVCGSTEYMAPEVVRQTAGYDQTADWWGVGCLLYECAYGVTPWLLDERGVADLNYSDSAVSRNIIDAKNPLRWPSDAEAPSKGLGSLLRGLLTRPPAERLGGRMAGASAIYNHRFFNALDWQLVEAGTLPMPAVLKVSKPEAEGAGGAADAAGVLLEEAEEEEEEEEELESEEVDPVSAQLKAFLKQKRVSEAEAGGDEPESDDAPATPAPKIGAAGGWGWESNASMDLDGSDDDEPPETGEGFFDGPAWAPDAEAGAWDRDF